MYKSWEILLLSLKYRNVLPTKSSLSVTVYISLLWEVHSMLLQPELKFQLFFLPWNCFSINQYRKPSENSPRSRREWQHLLRTVEQAAVTARYRSVAAYPGAGGSVTHPGRAGPDHGWQGHSCSRRCQAVLALQRRWRRPLAHQLFSWMLTPFYPPSLRLIVVVSRRFFPGEFARLHHFSGHFLAYFDHDIVFFLTREVVVRFFDFRIDFLASFCLIWCCRPCRLSPMEFCMRCSWSGWPGGT